MRCAERDMIWHRRLSVTLWYCFQNNICAIKFFRASGRGIILVFVPHRVTAVAEFQDKPLNWDVKYTRENLQLSAVIAVYLGNGTR